MFQILVPDRCFGFTKSIFISEFKGAFWLARYILYSKQESSVIFSANQNAPYLYLYLYVWKSLLSRSTSLGLKE